MAKLIVCGCSFSADSIDNPGTGYGHQTAKRLGWDVEILARQGCSNGGIRIQIDEVLRQHPDFAIIAPTFHDRMEIPASAAPYDFSKDTTRLDTTWNPTNIPNEQSPGWNPKLQQHLQQSHLNGYDRSAGIDNVNYGTNPYRMICETIFSLAENYPHPYRSGRINKDTQTAVKQYINHMYDSEWKRQQDEWIIRDGIMQLFYSKIPFLVVANNLWNSNNIRAAIPAVVGDQYLTLEYEETPAYATNLYPFEGKSDPGYHGSTQSQEYLADIYSKKICEQLHL
jgi:hypothetical protein